MKAFSVVIERCADTGMFVASIPGVPGAQAQGGDPDEAVDNVREILGMMFQDGEPRMESEFVELRTITLD